MGDEEIVDCALRAAQTQRRAVVRQRCGSDSVRYRRLVALVELAGATQTEDEVGTKRPTTTLEAGSALGRYVILDHVGSGGMGSVYAAYDRDLDRRVALKLLHAGVRRSLGREAQLLARVVHRNVVGVYDIGTHERRPFISMEFVPGQTLREWLAIPRPWPEVLRVMIAAGRGLQAAHRAGVVHRDFKPDNVLLSDEDGRIVVTDFGIACLSPATARDACDSERNATGRRAGTASTGDSALGGTPAYMAPEQFEGRSDPRTDVYAYCVVLFEALTRSRPPVAALVDDPIAIPPGAALPGWLAKVVFKGLRPRPEDRWPTMAILLARLERRLRRRWLRGAAVAAAVSVGVGVGWQQVARSRSLAACQAEGRGIALLWSDAEAAALRETFGRSALPYADDAAVRTIANLDAYADSWQLERTAACIATEDEGSRSPEQLQLARNCLEFHRAHVEAALEVLKDPDASAIRDSIEAVASLPSPAACNDDTADRRARFGGESPNTPAARAGRRRLAGAVALLSARRLEEAHQTALGVRNDAMSHGDTPLSVEAGLTAALAQRRLGRHEGASTSLRAAFQSAGAAGLDHLALQAAVQLTTLVGTELAQPEQGLLWGDVGGMLVGRLGLEDEPAVASLAASLGAVHLDRGDYEAALAAHRRAHRIGKKGLGAEHPFVLTYLSNVGVAHAKRGDLDQALSIHREVLAIKESTLGPDHPDIAVYAGLVASALLEKSDYRAALAGFQRAVAIEESAFGPEAFALANDLDHLGVLHARLGEPALARRSYERALRIRERTLGEHHPDVAGSVHHIAALDYDERAFDDALAGHRRALAILEAARGPDHPDVAAILSGVGAAHSARREYAEALATYERALTIVEASFGPDHLNAGLLWHNIGVAQQKLGRDDEAFASLSRALSTAEQALGPTDPRLVELLRAIGIAHARLGRLGSAVSASERALAIAEAAPGSPSTVARVRFAVARTLRQAGREPQRAQQLATAARQAFENQTNEAAVEEIDRWLERAS